MQPVRRLFPRHSSQHTISPRSHAEFPCSKRGGGQFRHHQLGCNSQSNAEQTLANLSPFTVLFFRSASYTALAPLSAAPYTVCWLRLLLGTLSDGYPSYRLHYLLATLSTGNTVLTTMFLHFTLFATVSHRYTVYW